MLRTGVIVVVTVLIGGAFAQGWLSEYLSPSPEQQSDQGQRQTARSNHMGEIATRQFFRLPPDRQETIRGNLRQQLLSVHDWLQRLAAQQPQIICFGEEHEQSTRKFLAEQIFSGLRVDTLLLESTSSDLIAIHEAISRQQSFVPLERANISNIIFATQNKNPEIVIAGIEETHSQRAQRLQNSNASFRDDVLLKNFWSRYRPGQRHALLFGAFHCSDHSNWLFAQLRRHSPTTLQDSLLNVRVLGEFQNESLQAMMYFLNQIGMPQTDFVILDMSKLDSEFKTWFELLIRTFRDYTTLLAFKSATYLPAR